MVSTELLRIEQKKTCVGDLEALKMWSFSKAGHTAAKTKDSLGLSKFALAHFA